MDLRTALVRALVHCCRLWTASTFNPISIRDSSGLPCLPHAYTAERVDHLPDPPQTRSHSDTQRTIAAYNWTLLPPCNYCRQPGKPARRPRKLYAMVCRGAVCQVKKPSD